MAIFPTGTPLTGASNAGGAGRNRDSEPISGFCMLLTLEQARCCQHGRRWTTANVPQVMTLTLLVVYCGYAGIRSPSATRDNQSPSPWFYSARPTKHSLALYTITVDRELCVWQQARVLDVTPKTIEQNWVVRTGKSKAEVTNNKKLRSSYCTIEATKLTTDRHEVSRGLFATAELLVMQFSPDTCCV